MNVLHVGRCAEMGIDAQQRRLGTIGMMSLEMADVICTGGDPQDLNGNRLGIPQWFGNLWNGAIQELWKYRKVIIFWRLKDWPIS